MDVAVKDCPGLWKTTLPSQSPTLFIDYGFEAVLPSTFTDCVCKDEEQQPENGTCDDEAPELAPLKARLILAMEQVQRFLLGGS